MRLAGSKALMSVLCLTMSGAARGQFAPPASQEEDRPDYVAAIPAPPPPQFQRVEALNEQGGRYGLVTWRAGREEAGGWIGVEVSKAPPAMAYQLRLRPGIGVVVDNVLPKSPAQRAGLQQYDLIEKLDDQLVVNSEQFTTLVRGHKPGDTLTITIIREGERRSVDVKLSQVRDQPMFRAFTPAARPIPPLPSPQWRQSLPVPGAPPRMWAPGAFDKSFGPPQGGDLKVEREEPGQIVILRDADGRQVMIVRDRNGKVLVKQPMNQGGPKAKFSPDDSDRLDRLKMKLRKQADDQKERAFRNYDPKQRSDEDDSNDDQSED